MDTMQKTVQNNDKWVRTSPRNEASKQYTEDTELYSEQEDARNNIIFNQEAYYSMIPSSHEDTALDALSLRTFKHVRDRNSSTRFLQP